MFIEDFGYEPLEMGEELRKASQGNSDVAKTIRDCQTKGILVPAEIIDGLMVQRITETPIDQPMIYDGVPRDVKQKARLAAIRESVGRNGLVAVYLQLGKDMAEQRMMARGRPDDLIEETRKKRLATFDEKTMPVIESFEREGKLITIDASLSAVEVRAQIIAELSKRSGKVNAKVMSLLGYQL